MNPRALENITVEGDEEKQNKTDDICEMLSANTRDIHESFSVIGPLNTIIHWSFVLFSWISFWQYEQWLIIICDCFFFILWTCEQRTHHFIWMLMRKCAHSLAHTQNAIHHTIRMKKLNDYSYSSQQTRVSYKYKYECETYSFIFSISHAHNKRTRIIRRAAAIVAGGYCQYRAKRWKTQSSNKRRILIYDVILSYTHISQFKYKQ